MSNSKKLLILTVISLLTSFKLYAADDIHYQDIKSLHNIIPEQDSYYSISPKVGIDDMYYTFTISSPHSSDLQITSIPSLIKAIHELSVLEWYNSTPQGNQVWKGAKDSVTGVGKGAKQIVMHPGDSSVAIGRSIARTGRKIGGFFKGLVKKKPKSSSGEDLSKGAGNFISEEGARQAAYELHLDVYSKNPLVIALLSEIGKERWAGSIGVSAASYFAMPGLGTASNIATGALTPGAQVDKVDRMIRDNSPSELNRELLRMFREYMSYDKDSMEYSIFDSFLQNPNYTPRQKAYIALYLSQLNNVKNLKAALSVLANCRNIEDAGTLNYQLQMMTAVDLNTDNVKFAAYTTGGDRIYGIITSGDLIAILPFDYATNTKFMQEELKKIPKVKKTRSIWLLGDATPSFVTLAKKNGIDAVYDGVLKFGAFKMGAKK